jgi:hypothetical protein
MEATLSVSSSLWWGTGSESLFRISSRSESISTGFKGPRQPINGWRTASPSSVYFRLLLNSSGSPQLALFKTAQLQVHRPFRGCFPWTRGTSFVCLLFSEEPILVAFLIRRGICPHRSTCRRRSLRRAFLGKELMSPRQTWSSLIPRLSSPERGWQELRRNIQGTNDHRLIIAQREPAMAF